MLMTLGKGEQMKKLCLAACAVCASAAGFGQAFDFESTALGEYTPDLSVANGGQTLTVTVEGASGAKPIVDIRTSNPALLGSHTSCAFIGSVAYGNNAAMRFTFASTVSSVTFLFGDAGGDDDGFAHADAYDAGGNWMGQASKYYGTSAAGDSMTAAFGTMKYFILTSDSVSGSAANSLCWEVSASTLVPEPASFAAILVGLIALRRKR